MIKNKFIFLSLIFLSLFVLAGCNRRINQFKQPNQINKDQQQSSSASKNNNQAFADQQQAGSVPQDKNGVFQYDTGDYDFSLQVGNCSRYFNNIKAFGYVFVR